MEQRISKLEYWVKKIFSTQVITIIIAFVSLWFTYSTFVRDNGGTLRIKHNDSSVNIANYNNDIVVCFTEDLQDLVGIIELTPTFSNPSKFSLKGFHLKYTIQNTCADMAISGAFTEQPKGAERIFIFKDNILPPYSEAWGLFEKFLVSNNGSANITSFVTYDGADTPYNLSLNIYWHHIFNIKDYDEWNSNVIETLSQRQLPSLFDLHLISKNNTKAYKSVSKSTLSSILQTETNTSVDDVRINRNVELSFSAIKDTLSVAETSGCNTKISKHSTRGYKDKALEYISSLPILIITLLIIIFICVPLFPCLIFYLINDSSDWEEEGFNKRPSLFSWLIYCFRTLWNEYIPELKRIRTWCLFVAFLIIVGLILVFFD